MADLTIIERKIKRKESEIESLQRKLGAARVYLQALKDVLRAVDNTTDDNDDGGGTGESHLRKGSAVAQARDVILERGVPVHIDELLQRIGKEPTRENKASLAGSLSAYVRRGEVFTRPAPATFGLVELQHVEQEEQTTEPPSNFGGESLPLDEDFDEIPF